MLQRLAVGIGLAFIIMFMWYITQPIVISSIIIPQQISWDMGVNNTYINTGTAILINIEYWWGPIAVAAIGVMWIIVAWHDRDPYGTVEGYSD